MSNRLLSSSAVTLHILTDLGLFPFAMANDFRASNVYNASHENVIGSPLIEESVLHGVRSTFSGGKLLVINQTMAEMGIVPRKDSIIEWGTFTIIGMAHAGPRRGKPLFALRRGIMENVDFNYRTQTTLNHNFSGTGQILVEWDELG